MPTISCAYANLPPFFAFDSPAAYFEPPDSDADLELDAHTRLLLRFNGSLDGVSYGWDGLLPEHAVTLREE